MLYNDLVSRHLARFTLVLVGLCLGVRAAQADTNFANCDRLNFETQQVDIRSEPAARLQEMGRLLTDIANLNDESKKKNSTQNRSFLLNCFNKKKATFEAHTRVAKASLQSTAEFNRLMGRYSDLLGGNPQLAFQYYAKAVELDPNDYDSFVKQYINWFNNKSETMITQGGHRTPVDIQNFFTESNNLLKPMLSNPKIPSDVKADLIKVRTGLVEGMMNSESTAQFDYKRLLQINPNDKDTLTKVAAYAYSRKNWEEAHTYLDRLAPLVPEKQDIQERNIEMKVKFNEQAKVNKLANEQIKKFPTSAVFPASLAWAQMRAGMLDKAHITNERALKLDRKNELAVANQSEILEKEGDEFKKKEMIGAALASYDGSFQVNPKNISVRKKMPPIIYEYHRSQKFEPRDVVAKDMDRLMQMLDPIFNKDNIDKVNAETYILASAHSTKPIKGAKACSYYRENYTFFTNVEMVVICVRALKASGRKSEAEDIVKRALENPKFQESRSQISRELLN